MRRFKKIVLLSLGSLVAVSLIVLFWYYNRPQPPEVVRELEPGIVYRRVVRRSPRPIVVHCVEVDLRMHHEFLMTPGDPRQKLPYGAQRTTAFLKANNAKVAISGDYFKPWHSTHPLDFYPDVGDRVETFGLSANRGVILCNGDEAARRRSLFLSATGEASFTRPKRIYSAISGDVLCVTAGTVKTEYKDPYHLELQPRAAVGLSRNRRTMYFVAVDGRQPNYSEGVTIPELGEFLRGFGASDAINLDGGGSATLCHTSGILNCPIDNRIPNRERPVANHLGVR